MATIPPIYTIPLEGVESEHCALIVNKGLNEIKDLETHRVELNNRRAIIATHNSSVLPQVVKTIRNLGYEVPTVKATYPVLQMHCASCALSIESLLNTQTGVIRATVNTAAATAFIEYLPTLVTAEDLQKTVQSIGYDLLIEEKNQHPQGLEELHEKTYKTLQQQTLWAGIFSLPLWVFSMFFGTVPYAHEIMWILSTPVIIWLGRRFFSNAWKQAKHHSANMDTLVALSTGVAYLFSVFNTLFPYYWQEKGLDAHVYFETAAMIITFILLGKLLEEKAKGKASSAIKKLMNLQPNTVTILPPGEEPIQIPLEKLNKGAIVLVKPGEKIAVDGIVIQGSSYIDESMLTGEPVAVLKKENDAVFAGTINQKGSLRFRAEKVGAETLLAQIIRMVQEAQGSKAPVQKRVDAIARIFVPVVMLLAILSFAGWMVWGGENGFTRGLLSLVTVLVIACPCALGLATPTAIMVGMGKGAQQGILIKDAESLELAKKINALVVDKTGTLTEGKPVVTHIKWWHDDDTPRAILFSLEKQSEHPLAEAIVAHFEKETMLPLSSFESLTGKGVTAMAAGVRYYTGSRKLLLEKNIRIPAELEAKATAWSEEAKTISWFANETTALAAIAIADPLKATSASAVQQIHTMGIEIYLVTGDSEATAKEIARETAIHQYRAEVSPQDKAIFIKELQQQGKIVAMAGDGINDSAALAQANVSIAMGKGSDIAIDAAKMTIVSSDLTKIPAAIRLSRQTVAAIHQNLFWAFIYNLISIPVAAGILYPFTGFLLNPMIAGAAMALSSVSVVANSLRLKWKK